MKKLLVLTLGCLVAQSSVHAIGDLVDAVINCDLNRVKMDLRYRINLNERGITGMTSLHYAVDLYHAGDNCSFDYLEITRLLLKAGADVHLQDGTGLTPLALAERTGKQQVAQLIRDHVWRSETLPGAVLALRLAQHPRVGSHSPAQTLTENDCRLIFGLFKQV